MFWHGLGELLFGLDFLLGLTASSTIGYLLTSLPKSFTSHALISSILNLPASGAAIGLLTALTTPLLWPMMTSLCWDPNLRSIILGGDSMLWLIDLYFQFFIPVVLPIGVFSG